MKKFLLIALTILISAVSFSQAPNKFKYQAVIRDESGSIKASQSVELSISILSGSATGSSVYSEEHLGISTNAYGLVNLNIGDGTNKMGDIATIEWGSSSYYLSIEIRNGTTWVSMGSSQLLSVPYAVYSNKAGSSEAVHGYEAGEGIEISKTSVITNTSPDQTVSFTNGTGIAVSGTYPDFTVTNISPNANHTGDASGLSSLKVTGMQGRPVADSTPNSGDALKWDGSKWVPSPGSYVAGSGISISGSNVIANTSPDKTVAISGTDITVGGSYPNFTLTNASPNATHTGDVTGATATTVTGIQGKPVSSTAPASGQIMKYDGTQWASTNLSAGNGLTYSSNQFSVNGANTILVSAMNAFLVSGAGSINKNSAEGIVYISNTGTVSIPVTVPTIMNGVNKKLQSVSVTFNSSTNSITKTVVKNCAGGTSTDLIVDNTSRNTWDSGTLAYKWTTYTITMSTPTVITGSIVVNIDTNGGILLQNIAIALQD